MKQHNKAAVRTEQIVLLPSATRPGTTFAAKTSPEIREVNLRRWRYTEGKYRERKESFLSNAGKEALSTAQAGSLVHRSVRKEVA